MENFDMLCKGFVWEQSKTKNILLVLKIDLQLGGMTVKF